MLLSDPCWWSMVLPKYKSRNTWNLKDKQRALSNLSIHQLSPYHQQTYTGRRPTANLLWITTILCLLKRWTARRIRLKPLRWDLRRPDPTQRSAWISPIDKNQVQGEQSSSVPSQLKLSLIHSTLAVFRIQVNLHRAWLQQVLSNLYEIIQTFVMCDPNLDVIRNQIVWWKICRFSTYWIGDSHEYLPDSVR